MSRNNSHNTPSSSIITRRDAAKLKTTNAGHGRNGIRLGIVVVMSKLSPLLRSTVRQHPPAVFEVQLFRLLGSEA